MLNDNITYIDLCNFPFRLVDKYSKYDSITLSTNKIIDVVITPNRTIRWHMNELPKIALLVIVDVIRQIPPVHDIVLCVPDQVPTMNVYGI